MYTKKKDLKRLFSARFGVFVDAGKTVPRLFAHMSPVNSTSETADVSELTRVVSALEREKIRCERACVRGPRSHFRTLFSRLARRDLARAPLTRARTRTKVCRIESYLRSLARTRVGSRSGLSGRTRRRYTFTSQHSGESHRDGSRGFQEGVAFVFYVMSEHVGDRMGSAPFKEGTIKYACYEVLKHAGPRGLSVRPRVPFSPAHPSDDFKKRRARGVEFSPLSPPCSLLRTTGDGDRAPHSRRRARETWRCYAREHDRGATLQRYARVLLLPKRSPSEKECVHPFRLPRLAYLLFLPNPSPSSQTPTSRSSVRRRTRYARVCRRLSRPFVTLFSHARARTPPRLLSPLVRANSRTAHASPI